jgi:hypothetical protein
VTDEPNQSDKRPDDQPRKPDPDEEYALAPDNAPASRKDDRPLKSIGSLMDGVDEDAASDEKAAAGLSSRSGDRQESVSKFDPRTGKRKPGVLTEGPPADNRLKSEDGPLVAVGKLGWKAPAIVATTLFVVSIILAIIYSGPGVAWWKALGNQLLHTPINIALGFIALFVLSRLTERPLGYWKGAIARIAVAVVAFQCVTHLQLGFGGEKIVLWIAAAALYFGLIWVMTRAAVRETFVMAMIHLGLVGLVASLFWLAPRVTPEAKPSQEVAQPAQRVDQARPPTKP